MAAARVFAVSILVWRALCNYEYRLLSLRRKAAPKGFLRSSPIPARSADNPRAKISTSPAPDRSHCDCILEIQRETCLAQTRIILRLATHARLPAKPASEHRWECAHSATATG